MGAAHLDEIYYRENIEIRGVVDVDEVKARIFMRKYGTLSWSMVKTFFVRSLLQIQ